MKKMSFLILLLFLGAGQLMAQELYVFSEPASNMPAKSVGIRMTNEGIFNPNGMNRTIPEVMVGFNKNLMVHAQGFFSNMDDTYRLEGGSLYGKYRFYSKDGNHKHLRAAAFARASTSKRIVHTEDINLEGDNSGAQAGIIVTQLLHKLALSGTLSYTKAFDVKALDMPGMPQPDQMLGYGLSSGYLLLPFVYKNYNQPNLNLYFEVLGKTNPENGRSYVDLAPAAQVIINSRTRIDLGYRFQLAGNMPGRYNKNMYLIRAEFNFFNIL